MWVTKFQEAVRSLIEELDKQFDLVMVFELMEESLVLLAHLLCLPIYQLVAFEKKKRESQSRVKYG